MRSAKEMSDTTDAAIEQSIAYAREMLPKLIETQASYGLSRVEITEPQIKIIAALKSPVLIQELFDLGYKVKALDKKYGKPSVEISWD